jgi:hypothetical protein
MPAYTFKRVMPSAWSWYQRLPAATNHIRAIDLYELAVAIAAAARLLDAALRA